MTLRSGAVKGNDEKVCLPYQCKEKVWMTAEVRSQKDTERVNVSEHSHWIEAEIKF